MSDTFLLFFQGCQKQTVFIVFMCGPLFFGSTATGRYYKFHTLSTPSAQHVQIGRIHRHVVIRATVITVSFCPIAPHWLITLHSACAAWYGMPVCDASTPACPMWHASCGKPQWSVLTWLYLYKYVQCYSLQPKKHCFYIVFTQGPKNSVFLFLGGALTVFDI